MNNDKEREAFEAVCAKFYDTHQWFKDNRTMTLMERDIAQYFWNAARAPLLADIRLAREALEQASIHIGYLAAGAEKDKAMVRDVLTQLAKYEGDV